MNLAHCLLLVTTESSLQSQPDPAFPPCYLSRVLLAYGQHYGQQYHAQQDHAQQYHAQPGGFRLSTLSLRAGMNLELLWQQVKAQTADGLLIEAEASLGSPLWADTTVADLAWDWRLATVLLVPLTPHALSQTIAYTALARQSRCHLKGIVLVAPDSQAWNDRFELAPPHVLRTFTQLPLLGTLPPWNPNASLATLAHLASDLKLEAFFPGLALMAQDSFELSA